MFMFMFMFIIIITIIIRGAIIVAIQNKSAIVPQSRTNVAWMLLCFFRENYVLMLCLFVKTTWMFFVLFV